ncbi:MAG: TraC family protein [Candidatus Omnitrophica bacterium]|nr:TraC family protein [Candidatus Omnitrophota bacterium]
MITEKIWENLFDEGQGIADFLPYYSFEDDVFTFVDGSLGKGLILSQIPIELKTDAELDVLAAQVETLITRFRPGFSYQFLLLSIPDVSEKLDKYLSYKEAEPSGQSKIFSQGKIENIKKGANGFFREGATTYSTREIHLVFTIRFFPSHGKMDLDSFQRTLQSDRQALLDHYSELCSVLQNLNLGYREIDGTVLVEILSRMSAPDRLPRNYNPSKSIRQQIFLSNPFVDGEGFVLDKTKTIIISLIELPLKTFPGMFCVGREKTSVIDLASNIAMIVNIACNDQTEEMEKVKRKSSFAFIHKTNILGDRSIEADLIKKDTDTVIEKVFGQGRKILNCSTHFLVWENKESGIENEIINTLHFLGCEGVKENLIGAGLFLACLPFGYDYKFEKFYQRSHKMLSDNASDIIPVWGSGTGSNTPAAIFTNRQGRVFFFDPFDSNSPHFLTVGITGAGKSVFCNNLIMEGLRLGSHIFVIDRGGSYQRICEVNGGQYVEIDPNNPTCINPFSSSLNPENLAFSVMLVSEMASGGEDTERLRREERAIIQGAIQNAYHEVAGRQVTLSDVAEQLNKDELPGKRLILKLLPFLKKGHYGGFFDGQNQLDITNNFVVFELGALGGWKDLQTVLLLALMYLLTGKVAGMKDIRKYLLIDEAWTLLNTENTARFIENAFRTFRKYRCSVGAISQQLQDFFNTKAGNSIMANAVNRIYLAQNPEVVESMKEQLGLNEIQVKTLKSIKTIKGRYSEAMIKTDADSGIVRLILDPASYWLFTTDPKDISRLNEAVKQTGSLEKAIETLTKERV